MRLPNVKRNHARQRRVVTEGLGGLDNFPKERSDSETQQQLSKLREATVELKQENVALREEIKRLRKEESAPLAPNNLEFSENVYWLLEDNHRLGPFCPHCYSERQRLATLLNGARFVGKTRWICPVCNHVFDSET